jgi:hypothetical protein
LHCEAVQRWAAPRLVTRLITTLPCGLVRGVCLLLVGCHLELAFRESPSARGLVDCMEIFGLAFRTCLPSEDS